MKTWSKFTHDPNDPAHNPTDLDDRGFEVWHLSLRFVDEWITLEIVRYQGDEHFSFSVMGNVRMKSQKLKAKTVVEAKREAVFRLTFNLAEIADQANKAVC